MEILLLELRLLDDKIREFDDVLKVAKEFDGKVINKRFNMALTKQNPQLCAVYVRVNKTTHTLKILSESGIFIGALIYLGNCELEGVIEENRLNYTVFKEKLLVAKEQFLEEEKRLKADIAIGEQRLNEYNELISKANHLYETFSQTFKDYKKYEFTKTYLG